MLGTAGNVANDYDSQVGSGLNDYSDIAENTINVGYDQGIYNALEYGVEDGMAATRQNF